MNSLSKIYKASKPSKLIKIFDANENWEIDVYCKPCPKRSYAFWIAEMSQFEDLQQHKVKEALSAFTDLMAKLVCLCACDSEGNSIFDYNTDVQELTELDDPKVLEDLFMGACQACGIESLAEKMNEAFSQVNDMFDTIELDLSDDEKEKPAKAPKKRKTKTAKAS